MQAALLGSWACVQLTVFWVSPASPVALGVCLCHLKSSGARLPLTWLPARPSPGRGQGCTRTGSCSSRSCFLVHSASPYLPAGPPAEREEAVVLQAGPPRPAATELGLGAGVRLKGPVCVFDPPGPACRAIMSALPAAPREWQDLSIQQFPPQQGVGEVAWWQEPGALGHSEQDRKGATDKERGGSAPPYAIVPGKPCCETTGRWKPTLGKCDSGCVAQKGSPPLCF